MGPRASESVASEWLSVAEAAAELGLPVSTTYRWIDKGWLPAFRLGRIQIKRADVEQLKAEGRSA